MKKELELARVKVKEAASGVDPAVLQARVRALEEANKALREEKSREASKAAAAEAKLSEAIKVTSTTGSNKPTAEESQACTPNPLSSMKKKLAA